MFVLNKHKSIANHYLAALRDFQLQKNRLVFRKNMERLGEILAYELSKTLDYRPTTVTTPLGTSEEYLLENQPVLITILRAGIPFYQGVLNFFSEADSGFVGAYRAPHNKGEPVKIEMNYSAIPPLNKKVLILIDPMLATGKSLVKTLNHLHQFGVPSHIHIVSAIAAPEGLDFLKNNVSMDYSVWTGAVDEKLNATSYIVPGFGDAGDLAFGEKI